MSEPSSLPTATSETLDDIARTCVALHVRMTARAVTRAYDEAMRSSGLKITQFVLLSALSTGAWRSVTELAERFALERTSPASAAQDSAVLGANSPVSSDASGGLCGLDSDCGLDSEWGRTRLRKGAVGRQGHDRPPGSSSRSRALIAANEPTDTKAGGNAGFFVLAEEWGVANGSAQRAAR